MLEATLPDAASHGQGGAERAEALDRTSALAIGAGLDALRDAGVPLVLHYRTTTTGSKLPERWGLPPALRDRTGVIFASAFPGADRLVDEVDHREVILPQLSATGVLALDVFRPEAQVGTSVVHDQLLVERSDLTGIEVLIRYITYTLGEMRTGVYIRLCSELSERNSRYSLNDLSLHVSQC